MNRLFRSAVGAAGVAAAVLLLAIPSVAAKKSAVPEIDPRIGELKKEIAALEALRQEKLNQLERKEAERWQNRYVQNTEAQGWDDRARQLEARYSRVANDLTRAQDEAIKEKNRTEEAEQQWEQIDRSNRGFELLIRQEIDRRAEGLGEDFPIGIAGRVDALSRASAAIGGEKPETDRAIRLFFDDHLFRIETGIEQVLERGTGYFPEEKRELPVWRLRLGTVATAELAREGEPRVQGLFKTGALRGRTFAWRSDLDSAWTQALRKSVSSAAAGESRIEVAVDLMQNRGSGSGGGAGADASRADRFWAWAEKGGVVMYPLGIITLMAILLLIERTITLLWRRFRYRRLRNSVPELLQQGREEEALAACGKGKSGLNRTLVELIRLRRGGKGDREMAEQAVQRDLVVEMPMLEKRMGLLATLGAVAPLLGLLGTVSGMITLFKVITEVGSNDARLLAGGISEALITTETGLIIAIPILLIHGWLSERVEEIASTLRATILETLNILWPGGDPTAVRLAADLRNGAEEGE